MIKVRNLEKKIDGKRIYKVESFTLGKGDNVRIIGENGSGKTYFIKTLLGIKECTQGEIHMDKNLNYSYYLNNYILYPHLTLIENLKIYSILKNCKLRKATLEKLFFIFGLKEKTKIHTRKLSSGEKQRLSLMITFIDFENLDFVLLDEPFNYIDKEYLPKIVQFIINLKCAKLITTHREELIQKYSFKIIEFGR